VTDEHDSDCATHNMPAYPNGPCDCSVYAATPHIEREDEMPTITKLKSALSEPKVTVLPYMGKPKETERERKHREYKAPCVVSDGAQRTPARIAPEWKE
jgi:hypothetical protein